MARRNLTADVVVEAGIAFVAREGWDALSLRVVAAELGVTPMALYRHVDGGDALRTGVREAILASAPSVVSSGSVVEDLARWARAFHRDLQRFPGLAGHLMTAWFDSPAMLERTDDLLALVELDGVHGFAAVAVTNAVIMYVLMRCEAERTVRNAGAVRRTLRISSATRPLPHLSALAEHYSTAEFDKHFEFGLQTLLAGAFRSVHPTRSRASR